MPMMWCSLMSGREEACMDQILCPGRGKPPVELDMTNCSSDGELRARSYYVGT